MEADSNTDIRIRWYRSPFLLSYGSVTYVLLWFTILARRIERRSRAQRRTIRVEKGREDGGRENWRGGEVSLDDAQSSWGCEEEGKL